MATRLENLKNTCELSVLSKKDLVNVGFLLDSEWIPNTKEPTVAPLCIVVAGLKQGMERRCTAGYTWLASASPSGCCLLLKPSGSKIHHRGAWQFWNKTATLETIGMMLPQLLVPELVSGRHIVSQVDKMAVWPGYDNGQLKNDVKPWHWFAQQNWLQLSSGQCCMWSVWADDHAGKNGLENNMSRRATTRLIKQRALGRFPSRSLPTILQHLLEKFSCDWDLLGTLLQQVKSTMKKL